MAFFTHGNRHAANRHARRADRQERQAHREEVRAVRDLARGNIGGFIRHEANASRHHNRAVRQDIMASNATIGRRHHHHHHRMGGGVAFAAGAAIGAVAAGGSEVSQETLVFLRPFRSIYGLFRKKIKGGRKCPSFKLNPEFSHKWIANCLN